jgi:hypothetical protein
LNNQLTKGRIKKETENFLEMNKNGNRTYQNLCNIAIAVKGSL